MRYLRMLSNSLIAAALATAYVLVLILELNPTFSLGLPTLRPFVETVGLFYLVHLTALFYVVLVVRQLVAREVFSPAWISVGVLVWLGACAAAVGASLLLINLVTFGIVLEPATGQIMRNSAAALIAATLLFVMLAVVRSQLLPRGRWLCGLLFTGVAAASVISLLVLRGPGVRAVLDARPFEPALDLGVADAPGRVELIAIDAGSLDFLTSVTAEGRLPNFGRILDAGAVMRLATIHPTAAEAVWAAVATGKLPQKNGIRSAGVYRLAGSTGDPLLLLPNYCYAQALVRFGFLVQEPHTEAALRARTIWSILSSLGISVGVVDWPLTTPAPAVRGYLVSDTFHQFLQAPPGLDEPPRIYPPELTLEELRAMDQEAAMPDSRTEVPPLEARFQQPGRIDRIYDRLARELDAALPAQVTIVRYQSLDTIGHYFLRFAEPGGIGDVTADERRRFGSVLEHHYALIDDVIGRTIANLGPNDLLLVMSGWGMEPLSIGRRLLEWVIGDPDVSGTHEGAPDGFLLAYGGMVTTGRLPSRASVLDVVPTILYFLGLPIGRDMDGYARTDLFERSFTDERPITFIPSYDR
jgi:predicted AlkP superfamily phosphohydrolase/phosphomutase